MIINQAGPAISFEPPTTTTSTLSIRHTTMTSNAGGGLIVAGAGTATVTVAASQFFDDDLFGLKATLTSRVSIFDSVFSGGSAKGLWATDTAEINMDHGLISDNLVGVQGDSPIRLSDVMLGHNATGIAGTQVKSFGNNRVASGNTSDGEMLIRSVQYLTQLFIRSPLKRRSRPFHQPRRPEQTQACGLPFEVHPHAFSFRQHPA